MLRRANGFVRHVQNLVFESPRLAEGFIFDEKALSVVLKRIRNLAVTGNQNSYAT